jgi:hypothetical protein
MATASLQFQTSLLPIFMTRLRTLRAIASGLVDLPEQTFKQIQFLLEQTEALIEESVGPIPPE